MKSKLLHNNNKQLIILIDLNKDLSILITLVGWALIEILT